MKTASISTLNKILSLCDSHPEGTVEELKERLIAIFELAEDELERLAYKQDACER